MDLGVRLWGQTDARSALLSQTDALDRPLQWDAELAVSEIATPAWVIGGLQRGHGMPEDVPLLRRISGGASVSVGPGTIHVALALRSPSALLAADAKNLINRYVRPLLRALGRCGAPAAYFGRDWISVGHRPAGIVGFAHDGLSGRALFEAFVAVSTPFSKRRPSFRGREPGTLEGIVGRALAPARVARAIADSYGELAGVAPEDLAPRPIPEGAWIEEVALRGEPPWAASVEESIGSVSAGRDSAGVMRLGGDFMASRDAVARLERSLVGLTQPSANELEARLEEAFIRPCAAIEGVRDLASFRTVLLAAITPERVLV
jgi:hypothetical protein